MHRAREQTTDIGARQKRGGGERRRGGEAADNEEVTQHFGTLDQTGHKTEVNQLCQS